MDRDGERAFNVYRSDVQQTRAVAEKETERLFELSRVRDRQPDQEQEREREVERGKDNDREIDDYDRDRDIPFFDFYGMEM